MAILNDKRVRFLVGVVISAVFLYWALGGLHLPDVWASMRSANYWWLVPSVLVYFLAVWVRSWRWDYMLRPIKVVPVWHLFPIVVIGYMGNNIFPFRAGEILRAVVLRQQEQIAVSSSLATIVVERVFDGLVMLLFVFLALPFAPLPGDSIRSIVILGSVLFFGAMVVFFVVATNPDRFLALAQWIADHLLPQRLRAPVMGFAEQFMVGLASLRSARSVVMIFFTTIIIWLLEVLKYWIVVQAFDFQVSFFALMLMNGVVNLATTLPSAPGYIGTFDGPGIAVLTLYGVPEAVATAYTLVLHAALWLPITLLGLFYMIRLQLGFGDLNRAVQEGVSVKENEVSL